ncbi:hypothetical protein [Kitasatospora sp. NPDC088346]|uniref:hypothetical protein n=1 Tax=Kitasatospora sp. NPDC088346 TaxID=3364073 RepID=UPI00381C628F
MSPSRHRRGWRRRPLRYLTGRAVQARRGTFFPWGTFVVNLTACTVLGFRSAGAATAALPCPRPSST